MDFFDEEAPHIERRPLPPGLVKQHNTNAHSDKNEEDDNVNFNYTLAKLRDFFSQNNVYITRQFIGGDNSIIFIKVYMDSIGDYIFIYFPSMYNVPRDDTLPFTELLEYNITEEDIIDLYRGEESEKINSITLTDPVHHSLQNQYNPITLENVDKEKSVRLAATRYIQQLDRLRPCVENIPYKLAILTDTSLCIINRHNDTEAYMVKEGQGLVPNVLDKKNTTVHPINHEYYIMIDLPSFFEKFSQDPEKVGKEIVKVRGSMYSIFNSVHLNHLGKIQQKARYFQQIVTHITTLYNQKNKFLSLMQNLTATLSKLNKEEDVLLQKLGMTKERSKEIDTLAADNDRSFKLGKYETDLQKIRECKSKAQTTFREVKVRLDSFLLTFDGLDLLLSSALKNIESGMASLGLQGKNK